MLTVYRFDRLAPYPVLESFSSAIGELTLVDSPHPALPDPKRLRLRTGRAVSASTDLAVLIKLPIRTVGGSPESVRVEFLPVEPPLPAGAFTFFLEGVDASSRGFSQQLTTSGRGSIAHLLGSATSGFILAERVSHTPERLIAPITWHRLGLKLLRPVDVIVDLVSLAVSGDARLTRSGLAES